jgi:hypothetical protein
MLSYDTFKTCVVTAHTNCVSGMWTIDNVKYLHSHPMNKEGIDLVICNAPNTKMLKSLERSTDVHQYQVLAHHQQSNPNMYDTWKCPALWHRGVPLNTHVDVPMHLLFLGIMKTVAKRVMEWTKQNALNKNFIRSSVSALQAVANCNVDWCMAFKINGPNFGGWVSENYLALAMFNQCLFSLLGF